MKIAIVGSRSFLDYDTLVSFVEDISVKEKYDDIDTIVSGGARGADTLGERYAHDKGYELEIFPAEWDKYGKRAGYLRNESIIKACDVCFAFWDGTSKGTAHDIELCKRYGKKMSYLLFLG